MDTAFQQYQSGALDGKDPKSAKPEQVSEKLVIELNEFQKKALILVSDDFNRAFFPGADSVKTTANDFYVVWFAKTLGNWKALVSTDVISGQYWEVTYDGNKNRSYVDHYVKRSNNMITDESYASMS
jgi:hypothetical protein